MTLPTTTKFGYFRIMLGDAGDPITYSAPCGFTSKSLTLNKGLGEILLPDCDDEDALIWVARDVQNCTLSVGGQGVAAAEALPVWMDAFESGDSIPMQIEIEFSTGMLVGNGYAQIETLEFSAELGGRVLLNPSLQSDGEIVFSGDLAPPLWLLFSGAWRDQGKWIDTSVWID